MFCAENDVLEEAEVSVGMGWTSGTDGVGTGGWDRSSARTTG